MLKNREGTFREILLGPEALGQHLESSYTPRRHAATVYPGGWLQRCQQHHEIIRGKWECCSQSCDGSSSKSKTTFRKEGKSELMLAPASPVENIHAPKLHHKHATCKHCCEDRRHPLLQTPYSPPSDTGWA